MKKFLAEHEKAIMLFFPSMAIIVGCLVLIPQLLKIFSTPHEIEYTVIKNIEETETVVDASEILDEVKTDYALAPEEAVPETVSEAAPASPYGWQQDENGTRTYLDANGSLLRGLKYIDDRLYYFDTNGVCAKRIGVDVSFYNGTVNWKALKRSGIDFAILRIGGRGWGQGGTLYDDSCFFNYLNSARNAGLDVGVYFYSAATNRHEAVQEASLTVKRLRGFPLELPVFIDTEYSGNYPNGRADGLSMARRMEIVKTFCRTVESAGYSAGIYASESFLLDELNCEALSSLCIWMASYTENNDLPSRQVPYEIWQLTDRGRLTGISGTCDINVIF